FMQLLVTINSMSFLEQFWMNISSTDRRSKLFSLLAHQELEMPILGRLHTFHLHADNLNLDLKSSFQNYAQLNYDLRRVSLATQSAENTIDLLDVNQRLLTKFECLQKVRLSIVRQIACSLANLTKLSVFDTETTGELSLVSLVRLLSPLGRLEHLRLGVNFQQPFNSEDNIPQDQIGQLASVKVLQLYFGIINHRTTQSRHLGWIFPRLEQLHVQNIFTECEACHFANDLEVELG